MPTHPLLTKATMNGNPVIKGENITFIWQGRNAPLLIDDFHNWEENPQRMQQAGRGVWSFSMSLAADAYLEYGFLDPNREIRLPDPLNHNRIWNQVDAYNHYFYMPRGMPSQFVHAVKGVSPGMVTRHQVATKEFVTGTKRNVYLYQPATKSPVPLVIVFDGRDYLNRARLNIIVDNLIAEKRISPIALAMIQNGGKARGLEYSCSDSTLEFITECIIPYAQEYLALTPPENGGWGVMGASAGALMAMYTGMRLPKIFNKVLSQSGAFILPEHEYVVVDLVRYGPRHKIDLWMDAGKYEWLLKNNRQMYGLLKRKEYKVKYHEFSGGHNYTCWRNDLWRGLEDLFIK